MSASETINFLADRVALEYGLVHRVPYEYRSYPNLLISGRSGTGKTVAAQLAVANATADIPGARTWILDPKGADSMRFLRPVEGARYFPHDAAYEGLRDYYEAMQGRMGQDEDRSLAICWVDELPGFIRRLQLSDKQKATAVSGMVAELAMMVRELGGLLIASLQRPDASEIGGSTRTNFAACVALGNLDRTAAQMVSLDREAALPVTAPFGQGHLILDSCDQTPIQVPRSCRPDALRRALAVAVTR